MNCYLNCLKLAGRMHKKSLFHLSLCMCIVDHSYLVQGMHTCTSYCSATERHVRIEDGVVPQSSCNFKPTAPAFIWSYRPVNLVVLFGHVAKKEVQSVGMAFCVMINYTFWFRCIAFPREPKVHWQTVGGLEHHLNQTWRGCTCGSCNEKVNAIELIWILMTTYRLFLLKVQYLLPA